MTNRVSAREIVLDMLLDIEKNKTPSHIEKRDTLAKYQYLDKTDRAFISRIFDGAIENKIKLDYIINQFSRTPVNKMKPFIRCLIRMSVYQLVFMDKTPDSAVCDEAVKLANKRGFKNLKGFVNGVLRNIARNKENIQYPAYEKDKVLYLSVMYSTPEWIIKQVKEQYGEDRLEAIIKNMNKEKEGISVRISEEKDIEKVLEGLSKQGVKAKKMQLAKRGYILTNIDYLEKLLEYKNGSIIPQDESSMLAGYVAAPKKDDYVIDVCAAPGGKSIHIAGLLCGTGMVEARDVSESKLALIEENIERIGVKNIKTKLFDGTALDETSIGKADIVVTDVPCSGLGVINKKSDIKYNMTYEKQQELIKLQRDILSNAVKYAKENGTIIFSTCTINKKENIENMKWLVESYNLKPQDISEYFPQDFHSSETKAGYVQLVYDNDASDGFFICKLKKQEI